MRLLVVEDEPDLARAVAVGLRHDGYAVDVVGDGDAALERLSHTPYDLVLLDLTLPGTDGWSVLRALRADDATGAGADSSVRVLLLTARDGLRDRVRGLDEGADDYLTKPFDFTELSARVRALLRRDAGRRGVVLAVGDLVLDTARQSTTLHGLPLGLSGKETALLRYFMEHPGHVVSAEELLDHVWDERADPFSNVVRVTVGTLRRKLHPAGRPDESEELLQTVVGRGYRLRERALEDPRRETRA